jgi:hypothetical protein
LETVAEAHTLEDCLYYISKAFGTKHEDPDRFIKVPRIKLERSDDFQGYLHEKSFDPENSKSDGVNITVQSTLCFEYETVGLNFPYGCQSQPQR